MDQNSPKKMKPIFVYADLTPSEDIYDTPYKERVSFVGNLSAGKAWFKLTNVTLSDSHDYLAEIREKVASGKANFLTTKLMVTGKFNKLPYIYNILLYISYIY